MHQNELVAVMVPRQHLARVYELIATLELGKPTTPNAPSIAEPVSKTPGHWTEEQLRRVLRESPPAVLDIFRALASKPDTWLTTHDLAAAIQNNASADWQTVAGTMGAFSRRVKHRNELEGFPFDKRAGIKSSEFRMTPDYAQLTQRLLEELDG